MTDRKIYKSTKEGTRSVYEYGKFTANRTGRKVVIKVRWRAKDEHTLKTYKVDVFPDVPEHKTST